jgi:hypothetical protein
MEVLNKFRREKMTKRYSQILTLVSLGFILILHTERAFAVDCTIEFCREKLEWTKNHALNNRDVFCSKYGESKSFDMGALACEEAWNHDIKNVDQMCNLIIKAVKADGKCS